MSFIRCLRQPFRATVLSGKVSLGSSALDSVPLAFSKDEAIFARHLSHLPTSIHHWRLHQAPTSPLPHRTHVNLALPHAFPLTVDLPCALPLGGHSSVAVLCRFYSSEADKSQTPKPGAPGASGDEKTGGEVEAPKSQSIFQRFKEAYKQHGKILVSVHIATSLVWFSAFYTAAYFGVDVIPVMEKIGLPDSVIHPFRAGGLGDIAVAYLLYKLFTPARYTVTLAGTNYAIKYLRRKGKMEPVKEGETLREFYKEGKSRMANSKLRAERLERIRNLRAKRKADKKHK